MMDVCTCTEVQHMITKIAYVILDCTSLVHQTNLCHSVKLCRVAQVGLMHETIAVPEV